MSLDIFSISSKSWEIGARNTVDQMCEGPLCKLGLCPSPCVSRWACSVTAPPCRCSPTRRTVAAAWGTPGDRINATSAPNYQVSPSSGHIYISFSHPLSLSLSLCLPLLLSVPIPLSSSLFLSPSLTVCVVFLLHSALRWFLCSGRHLCFCSYKEVRCWHQRPHSKPESL